MGAASKPRLATADDLEAIVETLTLAFADDPVWQPTLVRPTGSLEDVRPFWRIMVQGALRYPHVWMLDGAAAVAVWIPPGGTEMTESQLAEMIELAEERLGAAGRDYLRRVFDLFESAHPHAEPHYYLTLLGTHPDHRGHGLGMALLRENLARIDGEGMPAYLESSNPRNDARYQEVGFRPVVSFELPLDGATLTGMWRPPRTA